MVDFSGRAPGEIFTSLDEAARDAALYIGEISFKTGYEYATSIVSLTVSLPKPIIVEIALPFCNITIKYPSYKYEEVTLYTYTTYVTDYDPWAVTVPTNIPENFDYRAIVHTHPMGSGRGITEFSPQDIAMATPKGKRDRIIYVYGPNGEMRKYNPFTQIDELLFNDLPVSEYKHWIELYY